MAWSEGSSSCSNVVSGVVLEVLTAAEGPVSSPQEKVTYARLSYVTTTWQHAQPLAPTVQQSFPLSMQVRFLHATTQCCTRLKL